MRVVRVPAALCALLLAALLEAGCGEEERASPALAREAFGWAGEGEPTSLEADLARCERALEARGEVEDGDRLGTLAWLTGCLQAVGWRIEDQAGEAGAR